MASGSEVSLCVEVAKAYEEEFKNKKKVWVISVPSYNLFDEQSDAYKSSLLPSGVKKVAVEASRGFEWFKYADEVIGMDSFGKSAPAEDLFKKFGFSVAKIMSKLMN
jgi:transketolase